MGGYRVLFVAPDAPGRPRLALWDDATQIGAMAGVELHLVGGTRATRDEIARNLRAGAELVIWGGHGDANRLVTADGSTVDGVWLATQARAGAPEAVVVAACASAARDEALHSIAEEISQAGMHALAFGTAVEDRAAGVFCVEFTRALLAGSDVARANRVALSAVGSVAASAALAVQFVPAVINGYRRLMQQIGALTGELQAQGQRLGRLEDGQGQILRRLERIDDCRDKNGS